MKQEVHPFFARLQRAAAHCNTMVAGRLDIFPGTVQHTPGPESDIAFGRGICRIVPQPRKELGKFLVIVGKGGATGGPGTPFSVL